MASESLTPPPSGGGYAKYLVVLLLIVGGGLGVFFATRRPPPKPAPAPQNAERPTAFAPDTIEIPPDEPEAPDAGAEPAPPPKRPRAAAGDPWACEGDLTPPDIRRVLEDGQTAIRSCYERQLRNDNMLQGDVRMQVRVGNDGKVAATRVQGNMRDPEVKSCMQNIAKGWSFPAPSGGTCAVFEAPFHFMPKQ